jgi:hypothetical protein
VQTDVVVRTISERSSSILNGVAPRKAAIEILALVVKVDRLRQMEFAASNNHKRGEAGFLKHSVTQ